MKATELIEELKKGGYVYGKTCDTVKSGDPYRELKKVGVTMFATVDTVKRAREWGADMLIVHEPTYYDHYEEMEDTPVSLAKKKLIADTGMVIFRYHDYMHHRDVDMIPEGEVHYLGLKGKVEKTPYSASYVMTLDEPVTAYELAKKMENDLGIAHVKVAGTMDMPATNLALCFGTPSGVFELLRDESINIVMTGEACEWMLGEYARDASALGMNKTLIVMGHIGSERDGMRLLAERMKKEYTAFETQYFECGEVYRYLDKYEGEK